MQLAIYHVARFMVDPRTEILLENVLEEERAQNGCVES